MRVFTLLLILAFVFTGVIALAQSSADGEIYDKVIRRLANDPDVKGGAFEVDVKDGIVTIKGVVEQEKFKLKAEKLAKKIKGVKGVVNQLVVKPRSA